MLLSVSLLLLVCLAGSVSSRRCSRRIVDLTHTFDNSNTKYPIGAFGAGLDQFYKKTELVAKDFGPYWLAFNYIEFYEHMGTHMDAPNHFGKGRQAMHEIPPERLVGPGVVIDITEQVAKDQDYRVTVDDLKNYEKKYGRIPPNAMVMMNSGWAKYFPNPEKVFGSKQTNDSSTFHFPGWSLDAVKMLLTGRQVSVVGVDTPSTDHGPGRTFPCHVYLQTNNVPLLEYVANLDSIPQSGTTIVLGSMKTRGGTGGHTRILALIEDDDDDEGECGRNTANKLILPHFGILLLISAIMGSIL